MITRTTRLSEIAERHGRATPGEWRIVPDAVHPLNRRITSDKNPHIAKVYAESRSEGEEAQANADFIAHAHQYIPYLLSELTASDERLRKVVGLLREAAVLLEVRARKSWRDMGVPRKEPPFCGECMSDVPNHTPDCLVTRLRSTADEIERGREE
jgi:hypothetical protein